MSRSKRLLILLAVLAAACAAAFAALHCQHRQEQLQTSGQAVLEIDPDAVTSLAWTCGDTSAVDGQRYVSFGDGRVYLAAADPLEQYDITLRDCILNDEAPEMEKAASIAFSGSED